MKTHLVFLLGSGLIGAAAAQATIDLVPHPLKGTAHAQVKMQAAVSGGVVLAGEVAGDVALVCLNVDHSVRWRTRINAPEKGTESVVAMGTDTSGFRLTVVGNTAGGSGWAARINDSTGAIQWIRTLPNPVAAGDADRDGNPIVVEKPRDRDSELLNGGVVRISSLDGRTLWRSVQGTLGRLNDLRVEPASGVVIARMQDVMRRLRLSDGGTVWERGISYGVPMAMGKNTPNPAIYLRWGTEISRVRPDTGADAYEATVSGYLNGVGPDGDLYLTEGPFVTRVGYASGTVKWRKRVPHTLDTTSIEGALAFGPNHVWVPFSRSGASWSLDKTFFHCKLQLTNGVYLAGSPEMTVDSRRLQPMVARSVAGSQRFGWAYNDYLAGEDEPLVSLLANVDGSAFSERRHPGFESSLPTELARFLPGEVVLARASGPGYVKSSLFRPDATGATVLERTYNTWQMDSIHALGPDHYAVVNGSRIERTRKSDLGFTGELLSIPGGFNWIMGLGTDAAGNLGGIGRSAAGGEYIAVWSGLTGERLWMRWVLEWGTAFDAEGSYFANAGFSSVRGFKNDGTGHWVRRIPDSSGIYNPVVAASGDGEVLLGDHVGVPATGRLALYDANGDIVWRRNRLGSGATIRNVLALEIDAMNVYALVRPGDSNLARVACFSRATGTPRWMVEIPYRMHPGTWSLDRTPGGVVVSGQVGTSSGYTSRPTVVIQPIGENGRMFKRLVIGDYSDPAAIQQMRRAADGSVHVLYLKADPRENGSVVIPWVAKVSL